ncbi:MAG: hypothetical protein JWM28_2957 [Chitinophagaceae bacterium]|nr:hypothetical protein [Chitinophagaceae bacterium]
MKRILLLIIVVGPLTVSAQHPKPAQKVFIGFNFSPDYSFRTLSDDGTNSINGFLVKNRNSIEIPKLGYTTGFTVIFNVKQQTWLETGFQYSNKGYKNKEEDLVFFGPQSPGSPSKFDINYTYSYIGIPVTARFGFGKTKLNFITSVGFTTNFLLDVNNAVNYKYADGRTEKHTASTTSDFNKIDISSIVGFGINYRINDRTNVIAEPTFRYGIIKTRDANITEKLWSGGLNIGFYYAVK